MAPMSHPPCTPSASCIPIRCHPTPPPCQNPEKCLKKTISKGIKPCRSAVSIMATRSKSKCASCGKLKGASDPRSVKAVEKFLSRKSKEAKMRKNDRLKGSNSYLNYTRKKGSPRSEEACCRGKAARSIKPCVSAPTCSVHKHRPRPPPCQDPEKCFKKCSKSKRKCPSATETMSRLGSPCECARVQSKDSRISNKRRKRDAVIRWQKGFGVRAAARRLVT
ncbi:unnamed protein product [Leptosia nina]|uniref:Uncharacterized protein n=1 Tax=Leptosia nina TaxID=320188 RepID=A0AAV1K3Q0_9NEOP